MNDIVLFGRVLTVDPERRVHPRGAVYIHDGVIDAVQPEKAPPPAGFGSARRVRTGGLITPAKTGTSLCLPQLDAAQAAGIRIPGSPCQ